jgi:hypothetical protein
VVCQRLGHEVVVDGERIELIRDVNGCVRLICPGCGSRRRHLYFPDLRCRACLRLQYASSKGPLRLRRWCRVAALRRRLGLDPYPAPIRCVWRARGRTLNLIRKLREAEALLRP